MPTELHDPETRVRNRHIDFLLNPQSTQIILAKSEVTRYLRNFLTDDGQVEVQTPVLADTAGGALARPFVTEASEFSGRQIALRVAPELWLKRMVVGGFDRVFEIGPSFRNEGAALLIPNALRLLIALYQGVDLIHNPEFTTCEFYRAYTDLEGLLQLTERLVKGLLQHLGTEIPKRMPNLTASAVDHSLPFARLDFLVEIEKAIRRPLPSLAASDAHEQLEQILLDHSIPFPGSRSVPSLLDKLCATFIEPQCMRPTFIVQHPECMSPLSKSFEHPAIPRQRVAARAELFVKGQEVINMYEEENSPVEQRRKFLDQRQRQGGESEVGRSSIDESYLEALEWGLPPVGGWGCGIERLCMALTGTSRIGDVLSFGTLRNVMARSQ